MGFRENLNLYEFIDILRSQKSIIELSYLLSSRALLSYKPLSYKRRVVYNTNMILVRERTQ